MCPPILHHSGSALWYLVVSKVPCFYSRKTSWALLWLIQDYIDKISDTECHRFWCFRNICWIWYELIDGKKQSGIPKCKRYCRTLKYYEFSTFKMNNIYLDVLQIPGKDAFEMGCLQQITFVCDYISMEYIINTWTLAIESAEFSGIILKLIHWMRAFFMLLQKE